MLFVWLALAAVVILLAIGIITRICYRMAFYEANPDRGDIIDIPEGDIYEPYREQMENWIRQLRQMPHEAFSITAHDGLTLHGKFYEYAPGAPIELMFHGYRGSAERDLSGGVQRCFRLGHSALIVDQRCSGKSQGHTITFGIHEHKDCLAWLEKMVTHFGPQQQFILTGISMGAATVMMTANRELPPNVIGILADCGYTSPKAIIQTVIGQMGLPKKLSYPFVRLAARIWGKFDLEETSPLEAVSQARVPIIFFHGEADDYVPCDMSRELYDACPTRKALVTVPGAGHGLSFLADPEAYLDAARKFFH